MRAMLDGARMYDSPKPHVAPAPPLARRGRPVQTFWMNDSSGVLVASQSYWPYGTQRSATSVTQTDKLYTGQQQETGDAALGLYNYKARFYSTTLGRFVSADSVADGLSRYAYVHDNPLRFVDRTGHCFTMPDGTRLDSCSQGDALRWLNCAFGMGCSGDVQRLAIGGIGQAGYWVKVLRMSINGSGFMDDVLVSIASHGITVAHLNTISSAGWSAIGLYYRVSASFMEASLYDVGTGANTIAALGGNDIVGARPWWIDGLGGGYIGHATFDRLNRMIGGWQDRAFRELDTFNSLTLWAALSTFAQTWPSGGVNEMPWSGYQRRFLTEIHAPGVRADGVDMRDIFWDKWSDCLLDVACGIPLEVNGLPLPS